MLAFGFSFGCRFHIRGRCSWSTNLSVLVVVDMSSSSSFVVAVVDLSLSSSSPFMVAVISVGGHWSEFQSFIVHVLFYQVLGNIVFELGIVSEK